MSKGKRPNLRKLPMFKSLDELLTDPDGSATAMITMSVGQWDTVLAEAYRLGYKLLELDDNESPVAVYQKEGGIRS